MSSKYIVDDCGVIRSAVSNKALPTWIDAKGYVTVRIDGRLTKAHRFICTLHHGAPLPGQQCNHKDGNKANNRPLNLEWLSPKANKEHALRSGLQPVGENTPTAKLTIASVREIKSLYAKGDVTFWDLGKRYGVHGATIQKIVTGRTWKFAA